MLQLNSVPDCLAYRGIRGDLHKMTCTKVLPDNYRMVQRIIKDNDLSAAGDIGASRTAGINNEDEEEGLGEDIRRQKENESLAALNEDLAELLEGSVKCRKAKPPSTQETRKEAFDRYMKMIYRLPSAIKIDLEDLFDPNKLSFYPNRCDDKPCNLPAVQETVRPEADLNISVNAEEKKEKKASAANSKPKTLMKVKPWPADIPKKPVNVEKDETPPKIITPIEQPRPKTPSPPPSPPTPPQCPRTPTPSPRHEPTPELPAFLRQFADASWFKDLHPDIKCIADSPSPDDFSLQLLGSLSTCSAPSKIKILAALQELQNQGLLQSTDKLRQGLLHLVPTFVRPNMTPVERAVLVEMLNLLTSLQSDGCDLVKTLLALLAFKQLDLQETVLHILTTLGMNEAGQWLWPELESWDSELQDPSNVWKSLRDRADCWLESWIAKYKGHDRRQQLRSSPKWEPPTFSVVDVLNYFGSVQNEEYRRALCVAPPGRKNAVVLPLYDCSKPILRLGETYSMARTLRPPGLHLPPLRNRPFLTRFPKFISLPLPRVTLRPFHIYSDEDWVKVSPRRYFILQQSYEDYYR